MAAPHVSGLAALIRSADPTMTAAQVRALIEQNADDLGDTGPDKLFGHGRTTLCARGCDCRSRPCARHATGSRSTWPSGCIEVVQNGGFDNGIVIPWQTDAVNVSTITGSTGQSTWAAEFPGGISSHNSMTQTLTVPQKMMAATLTFDFRIETNESGWGTSPHGAVGRQLHGGVAPDRWDGVAFVAAHRQHSRYIKIRSGMGRVSLSAQRRRPGAVTHKPTDHPGVRGTE